VSSIVDDKYQDVTCLTQGGNDIIGTVLAADDGDAALGPGHLDGGADEIYCTFVEPAPDTSGTTLTDTVTATVEDDSGTTGFDTDGTTVTTS
jgi:hypothetical protein